MNKPLKKKIRDVLLILMITLPFLCAMVLTVITKPPSEGINVTGAQIYFTVNMPIQDLYITEAQAVSLCVMISLLGICLFLTRDLSPSKVSKRQHIAELIVTSCENLVKSNMGDMFLGFAPFIAAIMGLSALSSLSSLLGLYPPTSDLNIVAGWAILVFILITHYKLKGGALNYIKSFGDPIPVFAPFNIISEIATPISMAFRHYGNVLSGVVISALVGAALSGLSSMVLGWLPSALANIPILQIGLPAVLSLYFDLFSGLLQAFIFAMLTMLYISNGFPKEEYEARSKRKKSKKQHQQVNNI